MMEQLKNNCQLTNARLGEDLRIDFDIHLEGKVMELWSASPSGGKIMAQVYFYGDDGHKGDELLHTFRYPLKLSNPGSPVLEEGTMVPFQGRDHSILNEDKKGRDEVYAVFYLTMTFKTVEGLEVDAVISDPARTNTLKKSF
jgi:hypothetical protein